MRPQETTWKMVQVPVFCELLLLKSSKLFFLACLYETLANAEHVPITSMTKLEIETTENTKTITAQLSLFKLPFTYEQLGLIISAKFVFYCSRENKKKQTSVLEFETAGFYWRCF